MTEMDDRTIPAGERRLDRARTSGFAPVRRIPVALCGVVGGAIGALLADLPAHLVEQLRRSLEHAADASGAAGALAASGARDASSAASGIATSVTSVVMGVLSAAWPALLGGVLGVLAGTLLQTGGALAWRRPSFDVAARLTQMSGPGAWGRAMSGLLGVVAALCVAGGVMAAEWSTLAGAARAPLAAGVAAVAGVVVRAVLAALVTLVALAAVDLWLARRRWRTQLAMTPTEAQEESRAAEGNPQTRQRRASAHRSLRRVRVQQGGAA